MIPYHSVKLEDREWIVPIIENSDELGCEFSFGSMYIWDEKFSVEIAEIDGFFLSRNTYLGKVSYMPPVGNGDYKAMIERIIGDFEKRDLPFLMYGITDRTKEKMEELFPDRFIFEEYRNGADYLYNSQDLIELAGKKYHSKRNHISRFMRDNEWSFEVIDDSNIEECITMNEEWCQMNGCSDSDDKVQELLAVRRIFGNYDKVKLDGGLLRVGEKIVAYSLGERMTDEVYVIHVEKAFSCVNGAYAMINNQFAKHFCSEFKYINREDDMGLEGLRKAKLSYHPAVLLSKYRAKLNG